MLEELLTQTAQAAAYYGALIILMRLAGKRLAGQTTTFDLIVLITLGVVLQSTALQPGPGTRLSSSLRYLLCTGFLRSFVRARP